MVALASGINGGLYKALLLAHITCAVIGFGAVYLNGIYAAEARKRSGDGRQAVLEANHRVSTIGEYFIYVVPLLGVALILASHKAYEFKDKWIGIALVLYIIGIGVSHAVLIPGQKKLIKGGTEEELAAIEKRMAPAGAFLDILLVVIIGLMVWKPM